MFAGKASVLYTFYPPLEADWTFYLGLALVVVSTWITSAAQLVALRGWRKDHPGERVPLLAFMSIATYVMWDIASVGLAVEVVVFLLPWSLGLLPGVDPMLDRTLFWFTGHPIVYFWLLPIYVSWYGLIPKQAGGVLFSDTLTRVAFILFILLVPVGFHHQFVDPGISQGLKFTVAAVTFAIFFPSLMTAFSVMYALEIGGRRRGGNGLIGWFFKIPWSDPSVAAQVLAMIAFLLGGISGLMNASYTMNMEIHNTAFIPGHFHLTIGCAVALSYMGIAYWLIPYLERRELWSRAPGTVPGVFVFLRRDDFLARPGSGRHGGNAAAHRHGACHLPAGGVEDSGNHDRHRRHADVRKRDAVLFHPCDDDSCRQKDRAARPSVHRDGPGTVRTSDGSRGLIDLATGFSLRSSW